MFSSISQAERELLETLARELGLSAWDIVRQQIRRAYAERQPNGRGRPKDQRREPAEGGGEVGQAGRRSHRELSGSLGPCGAASVDASVARAPR